MAVEQLMKDRQLTKTRHWEQALNLLYIEFRDYCQGAMIKFDSADIHQARVNCRKLLTLLSILDPGRTSGLPIVFEKAQTRLGKVRDADVLIESFKNRRKQAKKNDDTKTSALLKAVITHQKGKRKTYRKKLANELSMLINPDLDVKWKSFLSEQLDDLVSKRDANVVIRELEVAYEQKKKACKAIFRSEDAESEEAFESLHQLRLAAKELRYTASAAAFALNQKFHAHEQIYEQIQEQLGLINDRRVWLETLHNIGHEKLDIGKKTWNSFLNSLNTEVLSTLYQNDIIPIGNKTR